MANNNNKKEEPYVCLLEYFGMVFTSWFSILKSKYCIPAQHTDNAKYKHFTVSDPKEDDVSWSIWL